MQRDIYMDQFDLHLDEAISVCSSATDMQGSCWEPIDLYNFLAPLYPLVGSSFSLSRPAPSAMGASPRIRRSTSADFHAVPPPSVNLAASVYFSIARLPSGSDCLSVPPPSVDLFASADRPNVCPSPADTSHGAS